MVIKKCTYCYYVFLFIYIFINFHLLLHSSLVFLLIYSIVGLVGNRTISPFSLSVSYTHLDVYKRQYSIFIKISVTFAQLAHETSNVHNQYENLITILTITIKTNVPTMSTTAFLSRD